MFHHFPLMFHPFPLIVCGGSPPSSHVSPVVCVFPPSSHVSTVVCLFPPSSHVSPVVCVFPPSSLQRRCLNSTSLNAAQGTCSEAGQERGRLPHRLWAAGAGTLSTPTATRPCWCPRTRRFRASTWARIARLMRGSQGYSAESDCKRTWLFIFTLFALVLPVNAHIIYEYSTSKSDISDPF